MFVAERFLSKALDEYGKHPLFQQQTVAHGIHLKHVVS
jgi:hypothetical protein